MFGLANTKTGPWITEKKCFSQMKLICSGRKAFQYVRWSVGRECKTMKHQPSKTPSKENVLGML